MITKAVEVKFWAGIKKDCPNGCWEWQKAKSKGGYGQLWDEETQKVLYTHRVAYEMFYGPIPDGMQVCHHCDNRKCNNPAHLFVGTNADNIHDKQMKHRAKGPHMKGEKHPLAKLTDEQVREICKSYKGRKGEQVELGKKYGVTHYTIFTIVHNKHWKHVT